MHLCGWHGYDSKCFNFGPHISDHCPLQCGSNDGRIVSRMLTVVCEKGQWVLEPDIQRPTVRRRKFNIDNELAKFSAGGSNMLPGTILCAATAGFWNPCLPYIFEQIGDATSTDIRCSSQIGELMIPFIRSLLPL